MESPRRKKTEESGGGGGGKVKVKGKDEGEKKKKKKRKALDENDDQNKRKLDEYNVILDHENGGDKPFRVLYNYKEPVADMLSVAAPYFSLFDKACLAYDLYNHVAVARKLPRDGQVRLSEILGRADPENLGRRLVLEGWEEAERLCKEVNFVLRGGKLGKKGQPLVNDLQEVGAGAAGRGGGGRSEDEDGGDSGAARARDDGGTSAAAAAEPPSSPSDDGGGNGGGAGGTDDSSDDEPLARKLLRAGTPSPRGKLQPQSCFSSSAGGGGRRREGEWEGEEEDGDEARRAAKRRKQEHGQSSQRRLEEEDEGEAAGAVRRGGAAALDIVVSEEDEVRFGWNLPGIPQLAEVTKGPLAAINAVLADADRGAVPEEVEALREAPPRLVPAPARALSLRQASQQAWKREREQQQQQQQQQQPRGHRRGLGLSEESRAALEAARERAAAVAQQEDEDRQLVKAKWRWPTYVVPHKPRGPHQKRVVIPKDAMAGLEVVHAEEDGPGSASFGAAAPRPTITAEQANQLERADTCYMM